MILNNKIDKYIIKNYNIDEKKDYELTYINGNKLIVYNRIDLIAKLQYLSAELNGIDTNYFETLYKKTIEAFSSGEYKEPGNNEKNSFERYKVDFIELYHKITKNGFDINSSILPIDYNGTIIDGGHRATIAAYNNIDVPCVKIENANIKYSLEYFKNRLLDSSSLDYLCFEYIRKVKKGYIICLWPILNADIRNKCLKIIHNRLNVIYEKNIKLNFDGMRNFMIEIYGNQPWVGNPENRFSGVDVKVNNCYKDNNPLTCVLVEDDIEKVLLIKKEIRNMVGIGNHSIHSTDNFNETMDMASLILNDNSIFFLNNGNPSKYKKLIHEDDIIILDVLRNTEKISFNLKPMYYYVHRNNSITKTFNVKRLDGLYALENRNQYFKEINRLDLIDLNNYSKYHIITDFIKNGQKVKNKDKELKEKIKNCKKQKKEYFKMIKNSKYLNLRKRIFVLCTYYLEFIYNVI